MVSFESPFELTHYYITSNSFVDVAFIQIYRTYKLVCSITGKTNEKSIEIKSILIEA